MTDPYEAEQRLARERAELARAVDELCNRLNPRRILRDGERSAAERAESAGLLDTPALRAATPLVRGAGTAVRANPLAAALAGAGLAWLAWSGRSRAKTTPEARPEWLVEVTQRREEAARLRAKIARSQAEGLLDEAEAGESLAEVDAALQSEIRRLMGRGLDGLEAETRAAALAAREAALKAGDKPARRGNAGRILTAGTAVAALAGLATTLLRRRDGAEERPEAGEPEAGEDVGQADVGRAEIGAMRDVLLDEAGRLSDLVSRLTVTLGEIMDHGAARPAPGRAEPASGESDAPDRD